MIDEERMPLLAFGIHADTGLPLETGAWASTSSISLQLNHCSDKPSARHFPTERIWGCNSVSMPTNCPKVAGAHLRRE